MLQWTGGSRRKVTTSRKSTENRQKQYFEQRRRRQQTTLPQNFDSGNFRYIQQPKEHRSLDIQSLLNLSNIAAKRESASTDGDACLKVPAGKPTYANIHHDSEPGTSQNNVETNSPGKAVKNFNNQGKGSSDELNHRNVFSEKNVSVLDLLDNERIDQDSDFNPVNEDHVAFSVDGLGKTGTETGVYLQWPPDRDFSYGFGSPSKNTRYSDLSRNTYRARSEMGSIGKDFKEAFSPSALRSSYCREKAFSIPNQETVELWDDVECNLSHSSKNASDRRKNFFPDIHNSNADLWDTSSGENFLCERDFDVPMNPSGFDATYNNSIQYGYPGFHASDNVYLPNKRASTVAGLGKNISELPTQNCRQRTSGDGWCGNLMIDEASDGLSSLSDGSCSSTYNSVLHSRDTRDKRSISFGRTGNTMDQSTEHDLNLGQSKLNSFHGSSVNLQEKFSLAKKWSQKGYSPFNTNSDFNSFYNTESSCFDLGKETPLTVFSEPNSNLEGQFFYEPFSRLESINVSPSTSFIKTHAPHRTFKEMMDPNSLAGFCKFESGIDDMNPSFFEEISLKASADGNDNMATFEIRCFQEVHFNGKPCRASNCSWTPSENRESLDNLTCKGSNEVKEGISDVESKAHPLGCNAETSSSTVLENNKKHEDMDEAAETRVAILSERNAKVDNRLKEDYVNSENKVTRAVYFTSYYIYRSC